VRRGSLIGGLAALAVAVAVGTTGIVVAQPAGSYGPGWMGPGMMYGNGWEWMGGMMLFGGIFWIVLLVVGVMAAVWFVRGSWHSGNDMLNDRRPNGLAILEQRYARGEVDRDEYLQKKHDILGTTGAD
jgi:putative membrane protein